MTSPQRLRSTKFVVSYSLSLATSARKNSRGVQSLGQVCELGVDVGLIGDNLRLLDLHFLYQGQNLLLLLLFRVRRLRGVGEHCQQCHGKGNGKGDAVHGKRRLTGLKSKSCSALGRSPGKSPGWSSTARKLLASRPQTR